MDTERSGLDEAMDVGSSTVSHLKSLKTAATFSKAGYGAALGGPFTAAIGAVIANRNQLAKILLVILAILLLPVLFIVMLPGLIFGSLTEQSDVLNSNSMISENIRASREAIVEVLEESHEDILAEIHAAISRLPQGDTASINDPYTYSISVNANLLISQFCASQDDYKNINRNQLKKLIRENKEGLFSYDVATETVTMEVTVDGGAEGESGTEQGQEQTQTVTFTKHTYTVVYAGDSYFADHVFHLTDKQKELAKNYAENLTAFFGTASSGIVAAINLSDEVLSYRPAVERAAAKYGMSDYVDLILAVMMQESGGRGLDVMQAAEGGFNTRYPHVPNGITDPEYSIECGVQELKYALDKAGCTGPTDLDRIKLALQGYNYGSAYIDWAMERDGGYTKENAIAYSDMTQVILLVVISVAGRLLHLNEVEVASVYYSNSGNLIVPIVTFILGQEWVLYGCVFMSVQLVFLWTHCKKIISREASYDWKKIILNINMISIFIGVILFFTGIRLPEIIGNTLASVGTMIGPASMIVTGMLFAGMNLKQIFANKRVYFITFLRLIAVPLIALVLIKLSNLASFSADGNKIMLIVFLAIITPSASTVTQMCQVYGNDSKYASAINVMTTLLSIITMPVMVMLFQMIM